MLLQLQRGNSVEIRGHQIGRPKPDGQRQFGAVQDRPRRDGGLFAAGGAFVSEALAAVRPAFLGPTARTPETRRPACGDSDVAEAPRRGSGAKIDERGWKLAMARPWDGIMFLSCSYAQPKPLSLKIWYARSLRDKPLADYVGYVQAQWQDEKDLRRLDRMARQMGRVEEIRAASQLVQAHGENRPASRSRPHLYPWPSRSTPAPPPLAWREAWRRPSPPSLPPLNLLADLDAKAKAAAPGSRHERAQTPRLLGKFSKERDVSKSYILF